MKKAEDKPIDQLQKEVDFLHFWIWEYGRRHTKKNWELSKAWSQRRHIKAGNNEGVVPEYLSTSLAHGWIDSNNGRDTYFFDPPLNRVTVSRGIGCHNEIYRNSDEIIKSIESDTFYYKTVSDEIVIKHSAIQPAFILFRSDHELVDYSEYGLNSIQAHDLFIRMLFQIEKDNDGIIYFVDNEACENDISREIEYHRKGHPSYLPVKDKEKDGATNHSLYLNKKHDLLLQKSSFTRHIRTDTDIARAIGLWLWDYCKENFCSPSQATKVIERKYPSIEMPHQPEMISLFNGADACIREGKVLNAKRNNRMK